MNYFEMYLQICHLSIEFSKEKKLLERKILQYWIVGTYNIIAVHERKDSIVITVAKITQNTGLKSKIKEKEIINVITVENSILK